MVTRSLAVAIFATLVALSARADIQFAPRQSEYVVEGMKFKQLSFSNGDSGEITYQPPPGWAYSGNAAKLTLRPAGKSQAEGTISRVLLARPSTFDEAETKKLIEETLASVPKDSTDVAVVSEEKNPLKIGGKDTYIVIISYAYYGGIYKLSMMFTNRASEQVRFRFVSLASDFDELQRAFLASQFTWQNL